MVYKILLILIILFIINIVVTLLKLYNLIIKENEESTLPTGFRKRRNDLANPILRVSDWILARSNLEYLLNVKTRECNTLLFQNLFIIYQNVVLKFKKIKSK